MTSASAAWCVGAKRRPAGGWEDAAPTARRGTLSPHPQHPSCCVIQAAGRRVAAGTELISELYLREFDFYQARAEASVMSMLEGDAFRAGEKAGWAVKVPLFAFVYHDVGPVRSTGT